METDQFDLWYTCQTTCLLIELVDYFKENGWARVLAEAHIPLDRVEYALDAVLYMLEQTGVPHKPRSRAVSLRTKGAEQKLDIYIFCRANREEPCPSESEKTAGSTCRPSRSRKKT